MPLKLRVQPELDDRSLSDVQDKARSVFDALGPELGAGMSRGLTSELDKIGPSFVHLGTLAEGAMSGISVGAVAAAGGIAAIVIAAERAGEALYGVGERFDAISDSIAARTGKIGGDLDALNASIQNVGATTASSLEQLGDIGARVSQSFGMAGAPLEDLTKQIADFDRMTGETLNIRQLDLAFSSFGVTVGDTGAALDDLYRVSTNTGIPVNELAGALQRLGPVGATLGLSLQDTESVIIGLNQSGLDASSTVMGLNRAAAVFAENNINLKTGLSDTVAQMRNFIDAGNEAAAVQLARDVFGVRGAELFVKAVRDGTLSVQTLQGSLAPIGPGIEEVERKTHDWAETWTLIKNRVSDLADVIGGPLFDGINDVMQASIADPMSILNPNYDLFGSAQGKLDEALERERLKAAEGQPGGPHPGVTQPVPQREQEDIRGRLDANKNRGGGGKKPEAATVPYPPGYTGSPVEAAEHDLSQAYADLSAAYAGGDPNDITAAQNRVTDAKNGVQKAREREAKEGQGPKGVGPQVPAPPGLGAPPAPGESASQYSAEQSYWGAVQKRQTAEANVAALQASGTATPSDMVKAENDLTKARSDEYQALLRLQETTNKTNDSLSSTSDQLGDIGVKLDQDFGISKGLPGIAENLTRFLASLAFAPVEGAMRGAQSGLGYPGGQGSGSGLAGMIGSAVLGPGQPSGGGGGAQFPFGGFPGGSFPGGYPSGSSGLPITYPGGSPYPSSGSGVGGTNFNLGGTAAPAAWVAPGGGAESYRPLVRQALATYGSRYGITNTQAWEDAIVRQIGTESGGNPNAINRTDINAQLGHPSQGLLQFIPSTFAANNVTGGSYLDPYAQIAAVLPYVTRKYGMDASGAPLQIGRGVGYAQGGGVDTVPAMLEPGEHVLTTKDVAAMGGQQGVYAFRDALQSQHMPPGAAPGVPIPPGPVATPGGPLPLPPGVKPGAPLGQQGPTSIGGISPPPGYGPGFTVTGGGLVGLLESLPATAVNVAIAAAAGAAHEGGAVGPDGIRRFEGGGDVASSVASAAINIGIEEINRAISFAGQATGILASGVMETFLPAGGSELANNNWITRFLGGIVGARPALPNVAGKPAQPGPEQLGPPPLRTEHYGTGAPPGPVQNTGVNIEHYHVEQSEDRAGQDLARHQMNQWPVQSGAR